MEDKLLVYLKGQRVERSRVLDERNALLDQKADIDKKIEALGDLSAVEAEIAELDILIKEREDELNPPVEEEATVEDEAKDILDSVL